MPVALYPVGVDVKPGEKTRAIVTTQTAGISRAYALTLYRPRFSTVAYVVDVTEALVDPVMRG